MRFEVYLFINTCLKPYKLTKQVLPTGFKEDGQLTIQDKVISPKENYPNF